MGGLRVGNEVLRLCELARHLILQTAPAQRGVILLRTLCNVCKDRAASKTCIPDLAV